MAKAKKNTPRSGNKQRKHTKQHLTQAELAMQRTRALSRRVEEANDRLEKEQAKSKAPLRIVYEWGSTPAAPSYSIEVV